MNLTLRSITKCAYGQLLAFLIAAGTIAQTSIIEQASKVDYYILYIGLYFVVFTASLTIVLIKYIHFRYTNTHTNLLLLSKTIPLFSKCILSCILDYLAGYFLNRSFYNTSAYLIIMISQLIYPTSVIFERIFQSKTSISARKITAFVVMSIVCFLINLECEREAFHKNYGNILCCLISNMLYVADIFLQSQIVKETSPFVYSACFSGIGFIVGPFISYLLGENPSILKIRQFFSLYSFQLVSYWMAFGTYYLISSPYINNYDVLAYNGSTITSSAFYGIYIIITGDSSGKILYLGLFIICILANMVIISKSKTQNKRT